MSKEAEEMYKAMQRDCDKCSCPTEQMFESMAAQFGYRASSVNASAMESFQLQVNAQNALLLRMQGELTGATSAPTNP